MPTQSRTPQRLRSHAGYRLDSTATAVAMPIYQTGSYQLNSTEHAANFFAPKELDSAYLDQALAAA